MVYLFYSQLEYYTPVWCILRPFGNVMALWYIFHHFGKLCPEKSGNLAKKTKKIVKSFDDCLLRPGTRKTASIL
jgi:hypothetical protein